MNDRIADRCRGGRRGPQSSIAFLANFAASEIEKAVARYLASINFEGIARKTVQEHLERLAGRCNTSSALEVP